MTYLGNDDLVQKISMETGYKRWLDLLTTDMF